MYVAEDFCNKLWHGLHLYWYRYAEDTISQSSFLHCDYNCCPDIGCGSDGRGSIPARARFSLSHDVKTGSGAYSAS
jgi:hypothetical protein